MNHIKLFENFNEYNFRPFNMETIYDLENDEQFHKYFYTEPTDKDVTEFTKWLNKHKEDYVILYHGTSSENDIPNQGIKKTTTRTKKSLQSETGFVYLSIFKSMAYNFGNLAYPYNDISVYRVFVKIKELKPDKDQLFNKRLYGENPNIKDNLASSLIFGHGARIKRNIFPYELEKIDYKNE